MIQNRNRERYNWWDPQVRDDPYEEVGAVISTLIQEQASRLTALQAWHAIYADREDQSLRERSFHRERRQQFNVIRNGIDTIHSKITKNRPTPWVVTVGGNHRLQRRADQLTHYLEGEFTRLDIHELGSDTTLDALIYGSGLILVYEHDGRPCVERVLAREILTDPIEEKHRTIRTMYRVKVMDRAVVQAMYPDADVSKAAPPPNELTAGHNTISSDLIMVVEAWHLPSKIECEEDADEGDEDDTSLGDETDHKGWHAIVCDTATLYTEEWTRPKFPFAKLDATKDPEGYWGIGYTEMMSGIQHEVNELSDTIAECFDLSVPSVWCETSSQIKREQVDDDPWRLYNYTGTPPIFQVPQAVSEQHIMREDQLLRRGLEMFGISMLSAESKKPAGLNSGKAMLVYQDVESERFVALGRRYEQFFVDLAELISEITEEIANSDDPSKLEAIVENDGQLEVILYKDVRMGESDPYRVRVTPTSALSHSPIGRLQEVDQMREMGIITDPDEIRDLVNMPDLRAYNRRQTAGRRLADRLIERALDGKRAEANQYMPLPYAHEQAVLALAEATLDDAPEKGLQMLRDLIGHIEALMAPPEPAAPPMPAGPPGPMPAGPPALGPAPGPGPMPAPPMGPPVSMAGVGG